MAMNSDYEGSVPLQGGLIPRGSRDFPLMDAHYVVTEDGTRLDDKLKQIAEGSVAYIPVATIERNGLMSYMDVIALSSLQKKRILFIEAKFDIPSNHASSEIVGEYDLEGTMWFNIVSVKPFSEYEGATNTEKLSALLREQVGTYLIPAVINVREDVSNINRRYSGYVALPPPQNTARLVYAGIIGKDGWWETHEITAFQYKEYPLSITGAT